jgi:POT family proton-dependent oligopeptide transporter
MVGQLYPNDSPLKDSAYIIFHIGINIGSFFGVLLCGYLGEKLGWHYGFGAAGVAMFLGLIIFYFGQHTLGEVGKSTVKTKESTSIFEQKLSPQEWTKLGVLAILATFSIVFWMAYEQGGSSMSIFAKKFTDRSWGDSEIPSSWFQSLNPMFIFIFAPLFSILWDKLSAQNANPHPIHKLTVGMFILGTSFLLLYYASIDIPPGAESAKVSMWFWVGAIFLQTIAELFFYPIGLSLVSNLSPKHLLSMAFGAWLCSFAVGNYLSGVLAGLISDMKLSSFFLIPFVVTTISGLALLLIGKKLIAKTET